MSKQLNNVLIVDYWSDRNRGDAAMQIATAELVRKHAPGATITVLAAYGWNQYPALVAELDETKRHVDGIVGGVRPTFVPISGSGIANSRRRKIASLLATAGSVIAAPFWPIFRVAPVLRKLLPENLKRTVDAISAADLVVWNGRNFRSDSARREAYEIWQLLYNPAVCFSFRKPVAIIGASIWPLQTRPAKRMVGRALAKTFFASLREANSLQEAQAIVPGKGAHLRLLPDLSLAVLKAGAPDLRGLPDLPERPRFVALTVVDWPNSGRAARDQYVAGLIFLCQYLLSTGTERITIVPQVTYDMESASRAVEEIVNSAPHRIEVQSGRPEVEALAGAYAEFDFLVATRMHSAIFATSRAIPVMTIPYDRGGKWGILDMMGVVDVDVPFEEASGERLVARMESVWARRAETRRVISRQLPPLLDEVEKNIQEPVELWKKELI